MIKHAKAVLAVIAGLTLSSVAQANEIFSCKVVAEATMKSDKTFGFSLYNREDSQFLSRRDPKVLVYTKESLKFGEMNFEFIGRASISSRYYVDSYWGLVEIYDYYNKPYLTLYLTRSNGYNSQKSNFLDAEMWHCNR